MVESEAPGGQAGQSSRIENYLGFPTGLSGSDLARRATTQARRLGAELLTVSDAVALRVEGAGRIVQLSGGQELSASSVLVSSGVAYRKMPAPGFDQFTGAGVYYGAAMTEAKSCMQQHVVVIGAANSAGQAAVYFARYAARVTMLVRSDSLAKSMSHYLIEQIAQHPADRGADGDAGGRGGRLRRSAHAGEDPRTEGEDTLDVDACFVFIGATPRTDWLEGVVARDERGFILAGPEAREHGWPLRARADGAGDQRPRRVRRRRRPGTVDQARRERRRRGLDGGLADPSIPGRGVAQMSTDTGHHTDAAHRELIPTGHPSLEDLRTIDLLAELSDEQLQQWSDAAELYEVQNGSTISREGEESVGTILVFEGTLHGTMRNGDREEPLSDQVGPTWVGAIQTLTGDLNSGLTLRAAGAARYAVVPPEPFTDLVVTPATGLPAGDVADAAGDAGDDPARAEPRAADVAGNDGRRPGPRAQQPRGRGAAHRRRSRRRARDPQQLDRRVRRVRDRARAGGRARRPADARAAVVREPDRARRAGRRRPRGRVAGRARGRRARPSRGRWPSPTRPPGSTGRSSSRSPTRPAR